MKPLRDHASEGRAHRRDAPCLYLTDDRDTAMAEVRPWVGAHITLAHFNVAKDCVLVDCSLDKTTSLDLMFRDVEVTPDEREQHIIGGSIPFCVRQYPKAPKPPNTIPTNRYDTRRWPGSSSDQDSP